MNNNTLKLKQLPDGWIKLPLISCCSLIKDGTHGTHKRLNTGIPLLSAKNITESGNIFWDESDSFISEIEYKTIHSKYELENDDLLLTVVGTLGRRALVKKNYCFTIQRSVAVLRCDKNYLISRYLYHFSASHYFQRQLVIRSNSTAQAGLYLGELEKIEIAIPKITEQQKIVEILDAIDKAIALTDTHITKLKKAKAGLLHDLLTRGIDEHGELRDYTRNPELFKRSLLGIIPKDWDVEPLQKHTFSSAFGPRFSSSLYADDGNVATLRTTDMDEEGNLDLSTMPLAHLNLGLFNLHILEVGDLLISRSGTCGITAVFPGFNIPVLPGAFLIRFRLKESVKAEFIRRYFNYELGRARVLNEAEGGVQKNLRGSTLLKLLIPIPPKQEQDAIIYRLQCYESRIITRKICIEKLKLLKKGLMSDLLTGRVRVKI